MKNIVKFASAAFALAVVLGNPSHAQTTDKQVVRCFSEYTTGNNSHVMSCSAWGLSTPFTKVPTGKYLSITDITIVPYLDSSGGSVTGLRFQKVLPNSLYDYFDLRHIGGNSVTHTWRTPALVLTEGTSLQLTSWWDTNTPGQVVVTGILSPDYNAAVR